MSAACAVTIARAVKPRVIMAKVIDVDEDGMITGVEPSARVPVRVPRGRGVGSRKARQSDRHRRP
jgi:hypothetical protein